MIKRKIVITKNLHSALIQQIKEVASDWEVIVGNDKEVWGPHIHEAEIVGGFKFPVNTYTNLKWFQSFSAGINQYPLDQLRQNQILLTSANGVHAYPISETIFAYLLGLTRKIHTYVRNQQKKVWHHGENKQEIHHKTIGIIGVGAIGKETAKLAKAFGMKVLGARHSGQPLMNVDEMYTPDQLNLILPKCDFVVITLPLTKENLIIYLGMNNLK